MVEAMSGPVSRCPWCSEPLPAGVGPTCPSCGATISGGEGAEPQLPGVTTIDAEAILRARSEVSRPRSRILSFITGEVGEVAEDAAAAASVKPPSDEVRREMLRLRRAAELAEIESEVALLEAAARLQAGDAPADAPADADAPAPAEADTAAEPPEDRSAL